MATLPGHIAPVPVHDPGAAAILRAYFADVAGRYYGRPATAHEIDTALAEDPSDELTPPMGMFLMARDDAGPAGCVGVRLLEPHAAELKRLFVLPTARGRGLGARLVAAAEDGARALGASVIRLDTRHDLVEARRLYTRNGYREIPGYNDGPYAEVWYEKGLA